MSLILEMRLIKLPVPAQVAAHIKLKCHLRAKVISRRFLVHFSFNIVIIRTSTVKIEQ
jgi:hypothetical protein